MSRTDPGATGRGSRYDAAPVFLCRRPPPTTPAARSSAATTTRSRRSTTTSCSRRVVAAPLVARPPSLPPMSARPTRESDDQPYATPWEELAAAYESLPAEDTAITGSTCARLRGLGARPARHRSRARGPRAGLPAGHQRVEIRAELERVGGEYEMGATARYWAPSTSSARREVGGVHHDAARVRESLGQTDKVERLERYCGSGPTIRSPSSGSSRISATSSGGRICPTCSRSGPGPRGRRCRPPSGAPGSASWPASPRSGLSVRTRRSTRWSAAARVGRRGARRGGEDPMRSTRSWTCTRRWGGSTPALASGPRRWRACRAGRSWPPKASGRGP